MLRSLNDEYLILFEKIDNYDWITKVMIFRILAIEDKKVLDKLIKMEEKQLKKTLEMELEEILKI